MSQLSNACLIAGLALAGGASAQTPPAGDDPYAWLESVESPQSLDWVKARNAKAEAEIAGSAEFKSLEAEILAILDSRLTTKGYGKRFLASLPPARQVSTMQEVRDFFHEG